MTDIYFTGGLMEQGEEFYGYSSAGESISSSRYNQSNPNIGYGFNDDQNEGDFSNETDDVSIGSNIENDENDFIGSEIDEEDDSFFDLKEEKTKKPIQAKNIDSIFNGNTNSKTKKTSELKLTKIDNIDSFLDKTSRNNRVDSSKDSIMVNGLKLTRVNDIKNMGTESLSMPSKKEIPSKIIKGRSPSTFISGLLDRERTTPSKQPELSQARKKALMKHILSHFSAHKLDMCNDELKEKISSEVVKLGEKLEKGENVKSDDFFFIDEKTIPSKDDNDSKEVLGFYKSLSKDVNAKEL